MDKQSGSKLIDKCKTELFGIDLVFSGFTHYYEMIANLLDQQANQFEGNYYIHKKEIEEIAHKEAIKEENKDIVNYENIYLGHLDSQLSETFFELTVIFPNNFRGFFLTQLYSFIESELIKICDYHHKIKHTDSSIKEIKGKNELDRVKKYLHRLCKIDSLQIDDELLVIDRVRRIRNKIVHHNGLINAGERDYEYFNDLANGLNWFDLKEQHLNEVITDELLIVFKESVIINELVKSAKSLFSKLLEDDLINLKF
jgi:hypothetical protein